MSYHYCPSDCCWRPKSSPAISYRFPLTVGSGPSSLLSPSRQSGSGAQKLKEPHTTPRRKHFNRTRLQFGRECRPTRGTWHRYRHLPQPNQQCDHVKEDQYVFTQPLPIAYYTSNGFKRLRSFGDMSSATAIGMSSFLRLVMRRSTR
jgi:hypothetical protein